jgi:SWIM zinc finger
MFSRAIFENSTPITQSVEAVKQLIAYLNNGQEAEELPLFQKMSDKLVLVLNSKKDAFYVTTPDACSCPSFIYRGGPCKHQRKYFGESKHRGQSIAETLDEHDRNLWKMPASYRRMVRAVREDAKAEPLEFIPRESFKPVLPDEEA